MRPEALPVGGRRPLPACSLGFCVSVITRLCVVRGKHCGQSVTAELPSNTVTGGRMSSFLSTTGPMKTASVAPGLGSENPAWELGETL